MNFKKEGVSAFLENFEANKTQIRNFPGCKYLELWQDADDPTVFMTYSHWERAEDLEQYRASELFKGVWGFTKTLFSARPVAYSVKKLQELP